MTKPLSKEALIRSAWITELRRQGHRKCTGDLYRDGKVCALGLLAEVAGLKVNNYFADYDTPMRAAGLTKGQLDDVWRMNDGDQLMGPPVHKHTFAEIADVVEGWFKD